MSASSRARLRRRVRRWVRRWLPALEPRRLAAVYGLACLALAQPIVRVLADAPEYFIAHGIGSAGTLLFGFVVIVVVPGLVAVLTGLAGRRAEHVVVGVLGALAVASSLQVLAGISGLLVGLALLGGVALAVAHHRHPVVREVLGSLAVLALLLGVWFVGPSRTGRYVRAGGDHTVAAAGTGDTGPVVVVVFDELPLTALLDDQLEVDATRFPAFAALAATSDWFRTTSSVSPQTTVSVPALLSGVAPEPDGLPVAGEHPTSLFLQLGASHRAMALEPVTDLCPAAVCETGPDDEGSGGSWRGLVSDTAIVYAHVVGDDALRRGLPSIATSWADFGDAAAGPDESAAPALTQQGAALEGLLSEVGSHRDERPPLLVAHLLTPHMPWMTMPDGSTYAPDTVAGTSVIDGALHWTGTEAQRRTGYQRLLLQLGAADHVLGEVRAALDAAGVWDAATVVVTADHGISFEPGALRDHRTGGVEVTAVPLFVKRPQQQRGRIDDRAALTIDIVPTILRLQGRTVPGAVDGRDLLAEPQGGERPGGFVAGAGALVTPTQTLPALRDVVERRAAWVEPGQGWAPVSQVGVALPVVGSAAPVVDDLGGTWSRTPGETGAKVSLRLAAPAASVPSLLLVTCDGTVGAAAEAGPATDGVTTATVYLESSLCGPDVAPELVFIDTDGRGHRARLVT